MPKKVMKVLLKESWTKSGVMEAQIGIEHFEQLGNHENRSCSTFVKSKFKPTYNSRRK